MESIKQFFPIMTPKMDLVGPILTFPIVFFNGFYMIKRAKKKNLFALIQGLAVMIVGALGTIFTIIGQLQFNETGSREILTYCSYAGLSIIILALVYVGITRKKDK